jgi:putative flippase GtrA
MTESGGQFLRFCVVGAIGFVVDMASTLALVRSGLAAPVAGRIVAFVLTASVTWLLNKAFTFRSSGGLGGWTLYLAMMSMGALLNVGVYALWVARFGDASLHIVFGIVCGSVLALGLNFTVSKYLIFKPGLNSS